MKKQYLIQKYVMANSVADALAKSKNTPIHEVFIHNQWFEKNANMNFFSDEQGSIGLTQ